MCEVILQSAQSLYFIFWVNNLKKEAKIFLKVLQKFYSYFLKGT